MTMGYGERKVLQQFNIRIGDVTVAVEAVSEKKAKLRAGQLLVKLHRKQRKYPKADLTIAERHY
jgi:hypothetical protein